MPQPTNSTAQLDLHKNLHNSVHDIRMYGAVVDGATNDASAWQAAITAAASGGKIVLPPGTTIYNSASTMTIPNGVTIQGAGRGASIVKFTGSAAFTFSSTFYARMIGLTLWNTGTADLTTFTSSGASQVLFDHVEFIQGAAAQYIAIGTNCTVIDCHWTHCKFDCSATASVAPMSFTSAGAFNTNSFEDCWISANNYPSGVQFFLIDNTNAGAFNYDNVFSRLTVEQTRSGIAKVLSANGTVFDVVNVYDLVGSTTADQIRMDKHAGGLSSRFTQFNQVNRRGGTLGGGLYDINLVNGGATATQIRQCINSGGSAYAINAGSNSNLLIDLDANAAVSNLPSGPALYSYIRGDGLIQAANGLATFVKAGTPTDADWLTTPPVGTIVVDTTGNKIWVRTAAATWKGVVVA